MDELKYKLKISEKFGPIPLIRFGNPIYIKTQRQASLGFVFYIYQEISKAYYFLRNDISKTKWNLTYELILKGNDRDQLKFLHLGFPALIVHKFNCPKWVHETVSPPPITEEI